MISDLLHHRPIGNDVRHIRDLIHSMAAVDRDMMDDVEDLVENHVTADMKKDLDRAEALMQGLHRVFVDIGQDLHGTRHHLRGDLEQARDLGSQLRADVIDLVQDHFGH
jgi:hypothetical protein